MTQPSDCSPRLTVFGVGISSPLPLWQTVTIGAPADLRVELHPPSPPGQADDDSPSVIDLGGSPAVFCVPHVARYVVENGKTIGVTPEPGADMGLVAQLTRGVALALAFYQQGRLLLHGSCFCWRERAVSVVGASGMGKSTILASMLSRGATLVSDGITVLEKLTSGYRVFPGPPELKLWPDAIERLGDCPERFPLVNPAWEKRSVPAPGRVAQAPVPLNRVLVLADADREGLEPLSPSAQAFELVRNALLVEYLSSASHPVLLSKMADLARHVPVVRLERRHGAEYLDALLDLLVAELGSEP